MPVGAYGTGFDPEGGARYMDVTVLLPGGATVHLVSYGVTVAVVGGPDAQPSDVTINTRFSSMAKFNQTLWDQQEALGLVEEDVIRVAGSKPGSPEVVEGTPLGVVEGLHKGFLTVAVDVQPGASTPAAATYSFSFDLEYYRPRSRPTAPS